MARLADAGSVALADEVAGLLAHSGEGVRYLDARTGTLPEALGNGHLADGRDSIALVHAAPPGRGAGSIP